jgi:flagellar biosynthesis protein FlhF
VSNIWSQEPTMVEMRKEIQRLRGLMEHQLSGLAWGDFSRQRPARAQIMRRLLSLGVSPDLSRDLLDNLQGEEAAEPLWREALQSFASQLPIADEDLVERGGAVALIGPTGAGKTTTVAKLAARCALKYGKSQVALITADNFRIGAHDQLRAYSRILDVPLRAVRNGEELEKALEEFSDRHLVLIDTAGVGHRDERLAEQASWLAKPQNGVYSYLVMSATTQLHGLQEVVRSFGRLRPVGCILTKLDESAALGGALSVALSQKLPIAYLCDGQNVPEDLQRARRNNLVNRAVAVARDVGCTVEEQAMAFAYGGMAVNAHN